MKSLILIAFICTPFFAAANNPVELIDQMGLKGYYCSIVFTTRKSNEIVKEYLSVFAKDESEATKSCLNILDVTLVRDNRKNKVEMWANRTGQRKRDRMIVKSLQVS